MTRSLLMVAAAVTASAGLFVTSLPAADDVTVTRTTTVTPAANVNTPLALPAGITAKNLNDDKSIEKAFKKITEDALTKNGFDNIVGVLVDQDRERMKADLGKSSYNNVDGNNNKRLNDLAVSLDNTWQSKYGHKFDVDIAKSYTPDFLQIVTGEVADATALVGRWPVDAGLGISDGKLTAQDAQRTKSKVFGSDVNLEKGRDVAVVRIAPSHGMPGMNLSLIHEAGGWKFDIPNTLTAQKLYDNLVSNLNFIDVHRADLTADAYDGYRQVTHAVLASMLDIDLANTGSNMVHPAGNANNR